MASQPPRLFTIPASAAFLPTLIAALRAGRLVPGFPEQTDDPLALSRATIYLPTRRACRLARDLFLDTMDVDAAILPDIVPIGDIDEDEIAFADAATGALAAESLALPPALGGLDRRLLLAQLILSWASSPDVRTEAGVPLVANSPETALALADGLARLMDDMTTRQVSWDKLDGLVPDDVDPYWQLTLRFLKIARVAWPAILAERGAIEPAARRDRLIAAEARRLAGSAGPVIAAGSTGSMPATAELLATIARLPHGAVVLPGLDTDLDDASWDLIGGNEAYDPAIGHPQFAMHALLRRLGVVRDAVAVLAPPAARGRERLVSEALRPAAATDHWRAQCVAPQFARHLEGALKDVAVIVSANMEEESLAIAVALREAVEDPHKTAALITPDRALARRVVAQLARWDVSVDDSGGEALPDTPAGIFARIAAEAALGGLAPVSLLALLKHPLFRLGAASGTHLPGIEALELALLRGPRPRPGSAGLAHALNHFRVELAKQQRGEASDLHWSELRTHLGEHQLGAAQALIAALAQAIAPLEQFRTAPQRFADIAARHGEVVAALGTDDTGAIPAFGGFDGKALAEAFNDIAQAASSGGLLVAPAEYSGLFRATLADRVVRRHEVRDVRVRIFGPLEARLQNVDRLVLGALVEGVWPPETRSDPWLSRPMRAELGLDLPERRISLSAHDFAQACGASELILSYPAKLTGAPTVTSRFLQRLAAVAGEGWNDAVVRGERYLALARTLDAPAHAVQPIKRPEPRPPLAARPKKLSVTDIENWLRDPYTIYAKHILRLAPLDAVDTPPGASDRGTVIHAAMAEFTLTYAATLPADPLAALLGFGTKHFAALEDYPEARAFWWPRFKRIAHWFAGWESVRREEVKSLSAEIRGEIEIDGTFKLSARADRIERNADGRYAILDYKTGRVPTDREVMAGLAPQLTLEAAILRGGGFEGIPAGSSLAELVYVALRGGDPGGYAEPIDFKDLSVDSAADIARRKLTTVVRRFADPAQPYLPLVRSMWKTRYGDYDHLARVKEWSVGEGEEEE